MALSWLRRSGLLATLVLVVACSSRAPRTGSTRTHVVMDAYGHILVVPDSGPAAPAVPPHPPASSKASAPWKPSDYIPLELYEKQQAAKQAQQQHFYVLPVGQGVAGETFLTSSHKTQTKQPMMSTPVEWQNDPSLPACTDKHPISGGELDGLAHWPARLYTLIDPGVSIHLVPEDLHALTAGRVVVGLRYPKKHKKNQVWRWRLYGFVKNAANHCSFNPQAVMMDTQGHILAVQDGVFTQSRSGSRFTYPGWRGELNSPEKTQYLFLIFTWPSKVSIPLFMVSDE
ncbi:MAG: hypothetical protein HKM02_12755 [Pseudomonadales bacterium]|nr:hypothetical protein [Pseudomonadales bacterium]